MNAVELYNRMEKDFCLSICRDDWSEMNMNEFITEQYRKRYMGLVTDNTDKISYVYTAVFPSDDVINKIIHDGRSDALLFVHHPMQWDITKTPVFTDIPVESLRKLREREISVYNLHVPLDANGPYSTTYNLAEALGISMTDEFEEYYGVKVGVIGTTDCKTVTDLKQYFVNAVGHEVKIYKYGGEIINGGMAALVAGGGNEASVYPYLREHNINLYITGIANLRENYQPSVDAHLVAKDNGVTIISGTHYSTEKFSCIKMVGYFSQFGIQGEFIPDSPCMADM